MKQFGDLVPLLRIAVVFIAGIITADTIPHGRTALYVWGCLTFSLAFITLILRSPVWSSLCMNIAVFTFGATLITLAHKKQDYRFTDEPVAYEAVILSQPKQHGKVMRFDMLITSAERPFKVRVALLRDTIDCRYLRLNLGDGIRAYSVLERPRNFRAGSNFDYARWMSSQNIVCQTFINRFDWQKCRIDYSSASIVDKARIRALLLRRKLTDQLAQKVSDDMALSIIAALSLGDKGNLDKSEREMFSVAGASHILALSGLHLGIIYFFMRLFFPRKRLRFVSSGVILLTIWFYVFLVGMSPSIVRAALTISLYEITSLLQRKTISLNTLAFAALVILIANPLALWDIGFQMSFCSLLSILIYFRPLYNCAPSWLRSFKATSWIWSTIVLSFVAQIGVAPLTAFYFGRISTYFAVTSIFVIPLAYGILLCTLFFFVFAGIPPVQAIFSVLVERFAIWLHLGVECVAGWPGASVDEITIGRWTVVGWYVFVVAATLVFLELTSDRVTS